MNTVQTMVIKAAVDILLKFCTPEVIKPAADAILDIVEDSVAKSENKMDDMLVLPLCRHLRETFNIAEEYDKPT